MIKHYIIMVKNVTFDAASSAARLGEYVAPEVKTLLFQPEGVLCSSVQGIAHEDFSEGGYYEI